MVTKHLTVFNSNSLREMEHFGMLKNEKMLKVPISWHNSSNQELNSSVFLNEKNLKLKLVRNEFFNANPLGHKYVNSRISWYVEFNNNTWNFTKNTWNLMKNTLNFMKILEKVSKNTLIFVYYLKETKYKYL